MLAGVFDKHGDFLYKKYIIIINNYVQEYDITHCTCVGFVSQV